MALKPITLEGDSFEISYDRVLKSDAKKVVVMHGWGSNRELMKNAFEPYFSDFDRVYIDLPGFGQSTAPLALTTQKYAEIIKLFLQEIGFVPDVVIGHSFGGKVAALLDSKVLVLIASSGIPTKKSFSVRAKIATAKALKPLKLKAFAGMFIADDAKGLSSVMYETFKNVVDEDFTQKYAAYRGRALLFWGMEDTATPISSGKAILSLIESSKLYEFTGGHFFFLDKGSIIAQTIKQEIELLDKGA